MNPNDMPASLRRKLRRPGHPFHSRRLASIRGLAFLAFFILLTRAFSAQPGSLDVGFDPGTGVDQSVFSIVVQPDGRVVIGGDFTTVNGAPLKGIARLESNGAVDAGFSVGAGPDDVVNAVALQGDKLIIGGYFTSVDMMPQGYIARLNTNGSLDMSFNPGTGADGPVLALAVQDDGKILVGGGFMTIDGIGRTNIARLNSDGSVDMTFDPGKGVHSELFSTVNALALQTNGQVVIGGNFIKVNGTTRNNIARLNTDGGVDTTFNPFVGITGAGVLAGVNALAMQSDGKVLVGGDFTSVGGTARTNVARINSNGGLDLSFNPGVGADAAVSSLGVQSSGKVVVGGFFNHINNLTRHYVAQLNADGSVDSGFVSGAGANDAVYVNAIHADGKVLIGGLFTSFDTTARHGIARLNGDAPTMLVNPMHTGSTFSASVETISGRSYFLEYKNALSDSTWTSLASKPGTGSTLILTDNGASGATRFYRVRVQ